MSSEKLPLTTLASLQNQTSALTTINTNFSAVSTKLDSMLSRDGDSPNQMEVDLDMNSYRVRNVGVPTHLDDALRLRDVTDGSFGGDWFVNEREEGKTHTFPAVGSTASIAYWKVGSQGYMALGYYEKDTDSVEIYRQTGAGTFEATPYQKLSVKRPYSIEPVKISDTECFLWVSSYADYSRPSANVYDSVSKVFKLNTTTGNYDSFKDINTFGAVRINYQKIGSSHWVTVANSTSSSQNLSGGPVYTNCERQKVDVYIYESGDFTLYDEVSDTFTLYSAKLHNSVTHGLMLLLAEYYHSNGTDGSGGNRYRSNNRGLTFISSGAKFGSLSSPTFTQQAIAASDVEAWETDLGKNYIIWSQQRDDGAQGVDDNEHFKTKSWLYRLEAGGVLTPLHTIDNHNSLRVKKFTANGTIYVAFCNVCSGGSTLVSFNTGTWDLYRFDEESERLILVKRIRCNGPYDFTIWEEDGSFWLAIAESTSGVTGSFDYSNPSYVRNIGTLDNSPSGVVSATDVTFQPDCYLEKDGSSIRLRGTYVPIEFDMVRIPNGAISLPPTGLSVGATYYVYVAKVDNKPVLVASTTGYSYNAARGRMVRSDQTAYTLVGAVRVAAGPAFADSNTQLLVLSWYNRKPKFIKTVLSSYVDRPAGASFAELSPTLRTEFLHWGGGISVSTFGNADGPTGGDYHYQTIYLGTTLGALTTDVCQDSARQASAGYLVKLSKTTVATSTDLYNTATLGATCSNAASVVRFSSNPETGYTITVMG